MSTQLATIIQEGKPFLVGEWLVEPILNRVTRRDVSVQLEPKSVDVLLYLAEHAGEVVPKHALLDEVWATEFAADNTIATRIADLRRVLGDDAQNPGYIETIRKRGYRLIAEVRPVTSSPEPSTQIPEVQPTVDQETNPYPGLAAFTEVDADRFFGREAEIAALWRRISARRLLAVIGPSGVGKSSLLRAGVAARAPPGWRVVVFTPGEAPTLSLARALAPDHAGDPAAMARLLGLSDADTALAVVSRWRGQFDEAVLVVDQFEELFTLNPSEVQASFIALLRRLVDAADVHVVLAMRDDYLYRCQHHRELTPVFEALMPLAPPAPEGLRRALKEPAARQLYRFSTELLVDRMIAEVEDERGALPLLAFAVHRLWVERDREQRLLTEEAYQRIGGVAGALAKHADATLERIGPERLPIVRELFRNLVTAEGTRAVREVDELLSVFPESQRRSAEEVLQQLVDDRLLTSYRDDGDAGSPRRVEIIHESLLTSWPRLVRWQAQDADAVLLRDQLRQAARTWQERGRSDDLLWTGSAFREYVLWRERYPGGLTDLEEDFAAAMTALATRRRRRRRAAVAAAFAMLLIALGIVALSRQQAVAEARRAEAAKLLALGQLRLEDYPTATLAHAIASLELADTAEARKLALQALWDGPTAIVVNENASYQGQFADSGEWLIQNGQASDHGGHLRVVAKDGSMTVLERAHSSPLVSIDLSPDSTVMFSAPLGGLAESRENAVLWSLPDGRRLSETLFDPGADIWSWVTGWSWSPRRLVVLVAEQNRRDLYALGFDGATDRLGSLALDHPPNQSGSLAMDRRSGGYVAALEGDRLVVFEIGKHGLSEPRVLGRHEGTRRRLAFDPDGKLLATSSSDGRVQIWRPDESAPSMLIEGPPSIGHLEISSDPARLAAYAFEESAVTVWVWSLENGRASLLRRFACGAARSDVPASRAMGWDPSWRLFAKSGPGSATRLWSLSAPSDADPLVLKSGSSAMTYMHSFHPSGRWLATNQSPSFTLWPLGRNDPWVIRAHSDVVSRVEFDPAGRWLASGSLGGTVRITPLAGDVPEATTFEYDGSAWVRGVAVSPDGDRLLVGRQWRGADLVPLDGGQSTSIGAVVHAYSVVFSPDGDHAAVAGWGPDSTTKLYVFRTDTLEEIAVLEPYETVANVVLDEKRGFLPDGRLLSSGPSGLSVSDPRTGESELLFEGICGNFAASEDGRHIAIVVQGAEDNSSPSRVVLLDLDADTETHLARFGDQVSSIAMDGPGTTIATGDDDGEVRVGSTDGSEPHLLLGHEGWVADVDIDPLGRWVASGSADTTVRIWPMPDLSRPPLHTLPHDELVAKLKSLTNLRVVRDEEDPTGWTLTHDPFPGWETVPTW